MAIVNGRNRAEGRAIRRWLKLMICTDEELDSSPVRDEFRSTFALFNGREIEVQSTYFNRLLYNVGDSEPCLSAVITVHCCLSDSIPFPHGLCALLCPYIVS